jgi:hypothetical protein
MQKRWNEGDVIQLTKDCELGKDGDTYHVLVTSGSYMTARTLGAPRRVVRTGRDYAFAIKIGTAPVDPNDLDSPYIPPGCYRLDRDVKNPRADRRATRDWSKSAVWQRGLEFVVREQRRISTRDFDESVAGLPADVADQLRVRNAYTVVELAGDRHAGLHRIGPGHAEQYAALAEALVQTEESITQFMTRIDCNSGFVQWLVEHAAIQRADLEKWWHRYQFGDDDDEVTKSDLLSVDHHHTDHHHTDHETTLDEPAEEG